MSNCPIKNLLKFPITNFKKEIKKLEYTNAVEENIENCFCERGKIIKRRNYSDLDLDLYRKEVKRTLPSRPYARV